MNAANLQPDLSTLQRDEIWIDKNLIAKVSATRRRGNRIEMKKEPLQAVPFEQRHISSVVTGLRATRWAIRLNGADYLAIA